MSYLATGATVRDHRTPFVADAEKVYGPGAAAVAAAQAQVNPARAVADAEARRQKMVRVAIVTGVALGSTAIVWKLWKRRKHSRLPVGRSPLVRRTA